MTRAPDILVVPDYGTPWVLALILGDVAREPVIFHRRRMNEGEARQIARANEVKEKRK